MIVVTGAAGFIGSCLIKKLNDHHFNYVVAVDDFSKQEKKNNLAGKKIKEYVHRDVFFEWLKHNHRHTEFILHMGARTDTTEFDKNIFDTLNVSYSKHIWDFCCRYQIPLIYASSAATYGLGEHGYKDDESLIPQLQPLNPYGESKNEFDKWVLTQVEQPFFWVGLKFFNVYGPNEYHKGRMASVIYHAHRQIRDTGAMKLFRSHREDVADGEQKRDFIYVKDVTEVIYFLIHHRKNSGIYNLGTGTARTFLDLAKNTFKAIGVSENIIFIDTPEDIRDKYQYYTQADMEKLRSIGYDRPFYSLEEGIEDYVKQYLQKGQYY
ncbi:MAG: ADP-glyceromanno-heptose 6-epimerase [Cytophagaceae bacterium]|nr:ADP-glyceromanno-heptose 6-epimerase [Cytophagaceae bacterium]MDW8456287.1 ADP-glyceromanno-heptose 6-epimerase [Cytophagaceae bacterium]